MRLDHAHALAVVMMWHMSMSQPTMQDHSLTLFVRCDTFRDQGQCDRRDKKLARQKRRTR